MQSKVYYELFHSFWKETSPKPTKVAVVKKSLVQPPCYYVRKQVFKKNSALYGLYLRNDITMLPISKVQIKASIS